MNTLLLLIALTQQQPAVVVDSETIAGLGARNIGSAAMSGRIAALDAVHEGARLTIYVGSASGGVLNGKGEVMDEKLVELFMKWLKAFEAVQAATKEKDIIAAHKLLSEVEAEIAATPAEGLRGLVVKLGLHQFLNDHADAASVQVDSAYADLVRLTGHDPASEICTRFEREAA